MGSWRKPFLSIIIPAFNEEARLPRTLGLLADHCARYPFGWEILAVVEASGDKTVENAKEIAARKPGIVVIDNGSRRGKGYAMRVGATRARGQIWFFMDADLSVPAAHIDDFLDHFASNPRTEVIVANRYHPASVIEIRQSWLRRRLDRLYNRLARAFSIIHLRDTQCGFKAMRGDAGAAIFSRQTFDGFACDLEIVLLAGRMGFHVDDLPVRWINTRESRVRVFRDTLTMFLDLFRVGVVVRRSLVANPVPARTKFAR